LSAYLGNVQLASRAFGAIRQRMESTGTWQPSWVIVSADHWWRETTGNPGPIDNRIPFIVKAPDARGERYDKPFSTVLTRSLVIGILKKEVKSADQLREWLDQHNSPPPAFYKTHVEPE